MIKGFTCGCFDLLHAGHIVMLKEKGLMNKRQRSRLCAHNEVGDTLHEMLIIHTKDTYVRPHKHLNKSESFHIVEGSLNVILFDEEGQITDVIQMGNYLSGNFFYYRLFLMIHLHSIV